MRCLVLGLAVGLGLMLAPAAAEAAELRYRAPAGCPSREDVQGRIDERARTGSERPVDLSIETGGADAPFVGEAVLGNGEDAVRRRLEGQTCESVVNAMVLVLALDRRAETAGSANDAKASELQLAVAAPTVETSSSERDSTVRPPGVDPRSSVEVALGTSSNLRELDAWTVLGSQIFVEVAAPGALAPWYRPSARFGLQYMSEIEFDDKADEARLWGAGLELCPLGAAAVSTRHLDVTFSACGVSNFGSATYHKSRVWVDAGAVGRANVQIGRKGHFRGFVGLDGGVLQRIGDSLIQPGDVAGSGSGSGALTYPKNDTMWTFALFGGVLFP